MKFTRIVLAFSVLLLAFGCSAKYSNTNFTPQIIEAEIETKGVGASDFIEIDNMNMHYIETGEGAPIVLIHGWLCWGAYWEKMIPYLSRDHHIYAMDLIGHGLSDKPLDDGISFSTDAQARRVIEFMEKKSITNAVVVGHSMGGEIAAKVALMAPDRVEKAVLICAAGMEDTPKLLPSYIRMARAMHLEPVILPFFSEGTIRNFLPGLMFYKGNVVPEEFVKDLVMANLSGENAKKAVLKVTVQGLFQDFIDDRCPEMKAKVLVISATDDLIVPPSMGKEYDRLLPDSTYMEFDQAAHMLPWERAEDVANAILEFCDAKDARLVSEVK
ncbi:MAG: alpha/beta hydrolase [Desulfatibacillum sp.]|nr:alpha/beta hydrolase [Desulfatibacillum sp.]